MNDDCLILGPITPEMISTIIANLEKDRGSGGHSVFIGQVRADEKGSSRVAAIEYSAYGDMVKEEADKIFREIYASFSDVKQIILIHSTGLVKAGEISLFVLVSAGHRRHAIDACSLIVELIKERLPVWKKEIYEDNTSVWKSDNIA